MEFDLRQWLLILGPVFIIGVLLHGYIRMRAGQNDIKMKLDKSFVSDVGEEVSVDDLSLLKAELPNGGARVINADGEEVDAPIVEQTPASGTGEEVPVLMESIELPSMPTAEIDEQDAEAFEAIQAAMSEAPAEANLESETVRQHAPPARKQAPPARAVSADEDKPAPKPEKFVVINVLALGEPFAGQQLLEILLDAGMTFGEMAIFHRNDDSGASEFSLASAVEPGTFDMQQMDSFSTPGVTLFMRVHELAEPLRVLDEMLNVAESIAVDLNGEVRDETRSVMTPQTIEHCRQSVRDFQFKHSA